MAKIEGFPEEDAGETPSKDEALPAVDDVKGVGPSPMPDDVAGHAGRLLSAKEARNL